MSDYKKYNNTKLTISITKAVVSFLLILIFVASGWSLKYFEIVSKIHPNEYLQFLGFVFSLGIISSILFFPLNFYSSFLLEHKYKLSNQTFLKWCWENIKGMLIGIPIAIPILLFFFYSLKNFENLWWLPFAIFLFLISVVLARIIPTFILPLFYKITPIEDEALREKIKILAADVNLKIENVYKFDMSKNTKKANAAFTGIGKSKRILLGDTLLDSYTQDEIETVLAHEFGHYKKKHIQKNILLGTIFSFLTLFIISSLYSFSLSYFGFSLITEIAALPILLLWSMLVSIITSPISSYISRKYEYEADDYAVTSTLKPAAFISTLNKLTDQNLGDKEPHPLVEWFFYSHPSIKKRIDAINKVCVQKNINFSLNENKIVGESL